MEKISKQVIVMRKDLKMRKGKMIAQGAHASVNTILRKTKHHFEQAGESLILELKEGSALNDWLGGRFTKICVSVDSEAELLEVYNKANEKGLMCTLITDAGLTEFNGVPTITCCAIGPEWSDDIDEITGDLKLL